MFTATHAVPTHLHPARTRPGLLPRALMLLVASVAMRRSRRSLLELDERLLRDVGLTSEAVRTEASRPAWDALDRVPWNVPAHWLR